MYHEYFGLKENPFSIAPDPDYLYMSDRHREALAHLLYGLQSDGGFVLLTGEVGTGKTTICRRLIDQVPAEVDLAVVLNPKVTASELLETICDELQIPRPDGASVKKLVDNLNTRLLETNAQGRKTVLIIDEAQNLSADVLEQLRLLTNLETSRRKLLQIILLGQPELRDVIGRQEMRQLAQRVTARYHLGPLERDEVTAYIHHRLQVAGCDRMLFPPAAVRQVSRMTGGVPRLINLLCDRALLGAYTLRRSQVDAAIVRQAGREVFDRPGKTRIMPSLAGLALGVLLIGGLGYWLAGSDGDLLELLPFTRLEASTPAVVVPPPAPLETPPEEPAVEEPPAAEPPLPTSWPAGFGFGQTLPQAFGDLAALWDLSYPADHPEPCSFAARAGLKCLDRQDSLQSLRGYDRPAVITLYNDRGEPFHVLLAGLADNRLRLVAESQQHELDVTALQSRWFGEYLLLWQAPDDFHRPLFPGDEGPYVGWLADKLAALDLYGRQGDERRLEGTLLGALKRFQFSRGLTPDGVLGPQTMIHLNSALGSDGPRLADLETD